MKTLFEILIELAKREGKKAEVHSIRKEDIPSYSPIIKMMEAEKESSKRARESRIQFKSRDYCPDVAQFLKEKHESENRKGLPEMYFKLNYN